ncbi:hypothetical protein KY290_012994 [Solanum tuberosum]|uniref:Uncharacterized protein n=1 Tax=Solanum tuberosum TaxID=4113 RepID=A0ABQ7VKS4_SOLTU|nr:hypothetical protein KY290_012994 [Solanum tuberosum]
MMSKSQHNEEAVQEREQEIWKDAAKKRDTKGEGSDTIQLDKNIIGVEPVALDGLDEVKSNLIELEEVNNEGLTNLELKLNKALFSLHRKFETLKSQVDDTPVAEVVGPVTVPETHIEASNSKEFRGERNVKYVENFL